VTRRLLRGDFSRLETARADGAYEALSRALAGSPEDVLRAVERSGERGRGGAGFPTGTKWRTCAETPADARYVVANGDEGDPGSFVDRALMELDPHGVLEGLVLCGFAVGAREGIVFVRSEYPWAIARMEEAIREAREAGILGPSVLGSGFGFDACVFPGLGSYVCGEETAMLNAIEGTRGEVRLRPPYPAVEGLHGKPTVVNNVETLVNVPEIVRRGGEAYGALGTKDSSGTKALCLNHGFARPGIVEVEFGTPLATVIEEAGGGADGKRLEAILLGGPMGSLLGPETWDVPVCYGEMARRGIVLGHGGLVAIPEGTDWRKLLLHMLEFMRSESCGKCVPCRLGSKVAHELVRDGNDLGTGPRLRRVLEVMEEASLCAFGQLTPGPVRSILERFGDRIAEGGA
jgi:NADH-quinone oxidoreductase subunit F